MSPSALLSAPSDTSDFTAYAAERGWGDGLPLVPPTPARVDAFLAATGADPDEIVVDALPPTGAACTLRHVATNAVMAGAPAASLPLLRAALEAMSAHDFDLHALNATTGSVVPAIFVNGPIRHQLGIPYEAGCLGGVAGSAPAIGRAIRLVLRNVAGQLIGVTSQSVYGTPGRVAGIVFGEWEERSPWAPFAERRGVLGNAVTIYGAMGTANICDVLAKEADEFLKVIGRSLAYPGANGFLTSTDFSEVFVSLNPIWAEIIGRAYPDVADVERILWERASLPISFWPQRHQRVITDMGRVRDNGQVHLVDSPRRVAVTVCGGLGGLHAAVLHSWGATAMTTRPVG